METYSLDKLQQEGRNALKSLLKLVQTTVEEVILTGPIAESLLTELNRCRQLQKVSGFKLTPAQLKKPMSSLPNFTHLSIEVNNNAPSVGPT